MTEEEKPTEKMAMMPLQVYMKIMKFMGEQKYGDVADIMNAVAATAAVGDATFDPIEEEKEEE